MSDSDEALRALSELLGEMSAGDTAYADGDPRIWREVGQPLVAPTGPGPMSGMTVAVKDLFSIAGFRVGLGNPAVLADAAPSATTAPAVQALLDAGASVRGIAQTDEFAYAIAGVNAHYGTPPNGVVAGRISGGSTSGPASAVALGQATIGLGTDTAGSLRVPASYQALWGLRTTHGAVSLQGVWPLAPSFDTVGWLARDAASLRRAAVATLGEQPESLIDGLAVAPALLSGLSADLLGAFDDVVVPLQPEALEIPEPSELQRVLRIVQAAEAWRSDGPWLAAHPDATLGPGVRERFAAAEATTAEQEAEARSELAAFRSELDATLGNRVLLLPSASSVAPPLEATPAELDELRTATLRLCSVAGVSGRPALSIPAMWLPGDDEIPAPVGLCLVGPRGSDLELIELGIHLMALAMEH